jgi:ABC-type glycerol-3-phosphate transport system substrate-binding protein
MNFGGREKIGLGFVVVCYLVAAYWVWTRSAPLIRERPVTIRLAHWQIEAGPPDGIDAIIARYEALHPRVKVEQQLVPGIVYKQWLRSNLAGGTGADIIEWGPWIEGVRDVPARYFEPVTAALAQPNPYNRGTPLEGVPWQQTFKDGLAGQRADSPDPGEIFGVTLCEVSVRLFCNRELLRAVTGSTRIPQTFDDMRRIFGQLDAYNRRTGRPPVMALAGAKDNNEWLMEYLLMGTTMGLNFSLDDPGSLALANRQLLAAYLEGRWSFSRPEVKAGLQLVREIGRHMKPGFQQLLRDEATREFLHGDALFIFTGTWDATSLRRLAAFPIDALRFPQATKDDPVVGRYTIGRFADGGGVTAMAMHLNKNSPHQAETLDFMRFMTSVQGAQLFTDRSGWLPATINVKIAPEIESFTSPQDGYALCNPYSIIGSNVTMQFARNMHLLLGEHGDVDKFTATLDEAMPAAVRADLQSELRSLLMTIRTQDGRTIAHAQLSGAAVAGRNHAALREVMEGGQTISEGVALQMRAQLEKSAPAK